jgi:hypothetical protein
LRRQVSRKALRGGHFFLTAAAILVFFRQKYPISPLLAAPKAAANYFWPAGYKFPRTRVQ